MHSNASRGSRPAQEEEERSWCRRLADAVFGYDYFISYTWSDGRLYATKLVNELRKSGFECFIDSDEYRIGDDWKRVGRWTLKRTSNLVLIGSPNSLESKPVLHELKVFRRYSNHVVPIDFGGMLAPEKNTPLRPYLPEEIIRYNEDTACLQRGPSSSLLTRVRKDFKGLRQSQRRMRIVSGATVLLTLLTIAAGLMFLRADAAFREQARLRMVSLTQALPAAALDEAERMEHERAALLSRQAYLFNRRYKGHVLARIDRGLRTILGSRYFNTQVPDLGKNVRSVVYDRWSGRLAFANMGVVSVKDMKIPSSVPKRLTHPGLRTPELAISPDGSRLAVSGGDGEVLIYEPWDGSASPIKLPHTGGRSRGVTFSVDGQRLAVGTEHGEIIVWDLSGDALTSRIIGEMPGARVNALAFSPDGLMLLAAAYKGPIVLWNLGNGAQTQLMSHMRTHTNHSVAFSPDGRWMAAASTSPQRLWIWTVDDLETPIATHQISSALALTFTADGKSLLVTNGIGQLRFWSMDDVQGRPELVRGHMDEVRALSNIVGGHGFLTGSRDGTVRVWEATTDVEDWLRFRRPPRTNGAGAVLPTKEDERPSERWIAHSMAGQAAVSRSDGGSLLLHRELPRDRTQGISLGVGGDSVAFSVSGRFVAIGHSSRVEVWDVQAPTQPIKLPWASSKTRDTWGDLVAEARTEVVELQDGSEPAGFPVLLKEKPGNVVEAIAFSQNGQYVLTRSVPSRRFNIPGTLHLHAASTASLANSVCQRVRRNLTRDEWSEFIGADLPYEKTCPDLPAGNYRAAQRGQPQN